eukprot:1122771-Prorocentrum_minimum.AAC.1
MSSMAYLWCLATRPFESSILPRIMDGFRCRPGIRDKRPSVARMTDPFFHVPPDPLLTPS